jgi:hypothetical protein
MNTLTPQTIEPSPQGILFSLTVASPPGADDSRFVLQDDHAGQAPLSIVASAACRRPCQEPSGMGLYALGLGGFGYDGGGAAGMGNGAFAQGPFGFDVLAVLLEAWLPEEGVHHVALGVIRDDGRQLFLPAQTVLVMPPPPPAELIQAIHYDPQTDTLTLHIE